ncbi:MAG: amino acid permease [Bryobacterales bacterium]|nr:amino acid permease [Bryobacterales bacterium]
MSERTTPSLLRAVGPLSLTAIAINGMVGAGIFALPANVSALVGVASPVAYLVSGAAVLLIALCFAEAGSLFDASGGPYLYARAAFGPFIGFQAGWMYALNRISAVAAISHTFASYLGYFWPGMAEGSGRLLTVTVAIALLTAINCAGVRPGVWAINFLTAGKLIPLAIFCLVGLFFLDGANFSFTTLPVPRDLQQASLLLIFALGGFESASIPGDEVIRPRRTIPLAILSGVSFVVVLYLTIQVVAMGTFAGLAQSSTPLASAASRFLGPAGGALLTIGAILSTTGTNSASLLTGSRMLYALADGGLLPRGLAKIHARTRIPLLAVLVFSVVAWTLAVSGTFTQLAAVAALSRLMFYVTTCLSVPVLRRKLPTSEDRFTLPGGALIPALAVAICAWLLVGSSLAQAEMLGAAILLGTVVFLIGRRAT